MYSYYVLFLLILIISAIITCFICLWLTKDLDDERNNILLGRLGMGFLIFPMVAAISTMIIVVFFRTTESYGSSKQALALNVSHRPMYDIVNSNDDYYSNTKYKVYLKSGGSKTVSPKVVHVNRSKTSYLKTTDKPVVYDVFGLKFCGDKYKEYTLYLGDK